MRIEADRWGFPSDSSGVTAQDSPGLAAQEEGIVSSLVVVAAMRDGTDILGTVAR